MQTMTAPRTICDEGEGHIIEVFAGEPGIRVKILMGIQNDDSCV